MKLQRLLEWNIIFLLDKFNLYNVWLFSHLTLKVAKTHGLHEFPSLDFVICLIFYFPPRQNSGYIFL